MDLKRTRKLDPTSETVTMVVGKNHSTNMYKLIEEAKRFSNLDVNVMFVSLRNSQRELTGHFNVINSDDHNVELLSVGISSTEQIFEYVHTATSCMLIDDPTYKLHWLIIDSVDLINDPSYVSLKTLATSLDAITSTPYPQPNTPEADILVLKDYAKTFKCAVSVSSMLHPMNINTSNELRYFTTGI